MVLKCSCKHDSQDELHGKNNRVHNMTMKKEYRCTVCLKQTRDKEEKK